MPLFDPVPFVDLSALVSLDALIGLSEFIDLRLLAWQAALTTAGASAILWHAILTYDLFPAPYPPHPPPALLERPSPAPLNGAQSDATPSVLSPGGTLPHPDASPEHPEEPVLADSTSHREVTPSWPEVPERFLAYRTVPLDVARVRVRELGGLNEAARRLSLPPSQARRILASERPLPPWVLNVLFDDWRSDERLRPVSA